EAHLSEAAFLVHQRPVRTQRAKRMQPIISCVGEMRLVYSLSFFYSGLLTSSSRLRLSLFIAGDVRLHHPMNSANLSRLGIDGFYTSGDRTAIPKEVVSQFDWSAAL